MDNLLLKYSIDYIEIYCPMAKSLVYWHTHALGFSVAARMNSDTGAHGVSSYLLVGNDIRLVLTSTYPTNESQGNQEIASFVSQNYCGVKRVALKVPSVKQAFEEAMAGGAIPVKFPATIKDADGYIEEASIKLYDHNELTFVDRVNYKGAFRPGYLPKTGESMPSFFSAVDHIASEVRINELPYWSNYLKRSINVAPVQNISRSEDNKTGMIMNINQSTDKGLTFVIAEPETYQQKSKVQQNIDTFGPGIHHLAFATSNLIEAVKDLSEKDVDFVNFPPSYYDLLRKNKDLEGIDIDTLEKWGILVDKEGDSYLLQKFIKPISDRPFFLYELVQRVNGYSGFALKNINVLKKAEEMEIMRIK
jgi:4-hydroxyphenylpyruvate dioxygenase